MSILRRLTGGLTYANVMATLALFVALGGTGYALSKLPKDSVKSKQIATGAVKSPEVADGSLLSTDFAAGVLQSGPPGPPGQDGADGTDGTQGPPGPTFAAVRNRTDPVATPNFPSLLTAAVTTPNAGRLLVVFSISEASNGLPGIRIDCTGATAPTAGLYVDGVAVPDTNINLQDNIGSNQTQFGVTSDIVPAGAHTLSVAGDCASTTVNQGFASNNSNLGAVLLGS